MKKSVLLLSSILSFNLSIAVFGASADTVPVATPGEGEVVAASSVSVAVDGVAPVTVGDVDVGSGVAAVAPPASVTAGDLERIKAHIIGFGQKLGLPADAEVVGSAGCFAWCSTTFDAAERFLLEEVSGQMLARFLAIALDDLSDGQLDGHVFGQKISYAAEVGELLGIDVSEVELSAERLEESLVVKLTRLGGDLFTLIQAQQEGQDRLREAATAFAKRKMDRARKSLAVALIREADRIIALELANGAVDGLDGSGAAIDYKQEMKQAVERSIRHVLYGVL